MKFIVIGLGNFGASLAVQLTRAGHDVLGVDISMEKVELMREQISHTIRLDSTDPLAVKNLPLKDTDIVVVAIGEDEGANILATAMMRQMKAKRLISRAVSPLHLTVLEAMGVDEVVHPEEETANRLAKALNIQGVIDSFEVSEEYTIIEAKAPNRVVGKTLQEVELRKKYNLTVLTTIKMVEEKNRLGVVRKVRQVQGVASASTKIGAEDILVIYGNIKDIERFLQEE